MRVGRLTISRRPGEELILSGGGLSRAIVLHLVSSSTGRARLSVDAPDEVRVMRSELVALGDVPERIEDAPPGED